MGKPGFEVHSRFLGLYKAVLRMQVPPLEESKILELVSGFNTSIENWRKKHSRPELKVGCYTSKLV